MKKSFVCILLGLAVFALGCSKEEKKTEGPSKGTVTTTPVTEGPVGVKLISQPVGCKNWEVKEMWIEQCERKEVKYPDRNAKDVIQEPCQIPDGWEPFAFGFNSSFYLRRCR